ncbi:MAG: MXAN_5187 C-terminal domain-containing protein [Pseudomonadota bacterium]
MQRLIGDIRAHSIKSALGSKEKKRDTSISAILENVAPVQGEESAYVAAEPAAGAKGPLPFPADDEDLASEEPTRTVEQDSLAAPAPATPSPLEHATTDDSALVNLDDGSISPRQQQPPATNSDPLGLFTPVARDNDANLPPPSSRPKPTPAAPKSAGSPPKPAPQPYEATKPAAFSDFAESDFGSLNDIEPAAEPPPRPPSAPREALTNEATVMAPAPENLLAQMAEAPATREPPREPMKHPLLDDGATRIAEIPPDLLSFSAERTVSSKKGQALDPFAPRNADAPGSLLDMIGEEDATPSEAAQDKETEFEAHTRALFVEFMATRARCGESTKGVTFDSFLLKVRKNRESLIAQRGFKEVRFEVYVKDGKAALKAVPVR